MGEVCLFQDGQLRFYHLLFVIFAWCELYLRVHQTKRVAQAFILSWRDAIYAIKETAS
jgi:hypothetical protein